MSEKITPPELCPKCGRPWKPEHWYDGSVPGFMKCSRLTGGCGNFLSLDPEENSAAEIDRLRSEVEHWKGQADANTRLAVDARNRELVQIEEVERLTTTVEFWRDRGNKAIDERDAMPAKLDEELRGLKYNLMATRQMEEERSAQLRSAEAACRRDATELGRIRAALTREHSKGADDCVSVLSLAEIRMKDLATAESRAATLAHGEAQAVKMCGVLAEGVLLYRDQFVCAGRATLERIKEWHREHGHLAGKDGGK